MFKTNLVIICYHGVVETFPEGYNSSGKHILNSEFERQISFLANNFEVVTMREIDSAVRGMRSLPAECVAITFDDGYLNNLEVAHPILQKYNLPATLYVATHFISRTSLIWTDELERLILEASPIPPRKLFEGKIEIDLTNRESRLKTLSSAKRLLKSLHPCKRKATLDLLAASLSSHANEVRHPSLHDFLDWEQLRVMKNSGVWEVGAHTQSHNSLGLLSVSEGRYEIVDSMNKVAEELGGNHPPLFSYPEGQERDMPEYAIDTLKKLGLSSAPSAIYGMNEMPFTSSINYLKLRRYMVGFEGLAFPWLM